jgi:hypothetical protein
MAARLGPQNEKKRTDLSPASRVESGGEYVMVIAPGLKAADEVSVYPVVSPGQRQANRVAGVTPMYHVAVIALGPANAQPIRMIDQAGLIHAQPLVALYWDAGRLAARPGGESRTALGRRDTGNQRQAIDGQLRSGRTSGLFEPG